jgi:hypothetical protein
MFNFIFLMLFIIILLFIYICIFKSDILPKTIEDKLIVLAIVIGIGFFLSFLIFIISILAIPVCLFLIYFVFINSLKK